MFLSKQSNLIEDIDALMDEERAVLKSGELHRLPDLLNRKEALFEKLKAHEGATEEELRSLREKSTRNQPLLEAAMSAVRAVGDRMKDLSRVRNSLETYNQKGQRYAVSMTSGGTFEKRT
ncbi:hypothetical protein [Shimia haliotis]|uniref:FlgN protein n=1 Tax=Shimia haliotis TaxID=1280847 RepID=A0A1I4DD65_9RHOB|nr:hypothetical protein [Shimia haliotis]SFK90859.1 hypothetical protein SAMN04488036_10357 [Shimia haliotis]